MPNNYGDCVTSFLGAAEQDVLVIAPFMQAPTLANLLNNTRKSVNTKVVTRWRPTDILSHVSDLDVFELTESKAIPLFLQQDLHAKIFIADDQCLVGSANVTDTALGWRTPPNLELLVPARRSSPEIENFLEHLLATSIQATRDHKIYLQKLLQELSGNPNIPISSTIDYKSTMALLPFDWVPRTMNPEELYAVYLYDMKADVGRAALPNMRYELAQFDRIPGMSESAFQAWIASSILQTPIVAGVLAHIDSRGSIGEDDIAKLLGDMKIDLDTRNPRDVLQVLQRWLSYFLNTRFETTAETIRLRRSCLI